MPTSGSACASTPWFAPPPPASPGPTSDSSTHGNVSSPEPTRVLDRAGDRLDVTAARVAAVDPAVQLARGWTITRRDDGTIVRSVDDVGVGDTITTALGDGTVTSTITGTTPDHASSGERSSDRTTPKD